MAADEVGMANTLPAEPGKRHPRLPERADQLCKASLRKADEQHASEEVGHAIERMRQLRGWSLKELAGALDRDPRQVARWIAGTEHAHLAAIFAIESLQRPLVIALAERLAGDAVSVETTVRIRKFA